VLILLIAIATQLPQCRVKNQANGVTKYIGRRMGRQQRRSSFILAYGQTWVNFIDECAHIVAELMKLNQ